MSIYQQLLAKQNTNDPIKVGVIGAGQMGFGMISQIATVPGMVVTGISDISLEHALQAKDAYLSNLVGANDVLVSTDFKVIIAFQEVDVVVDATGIPEVGAKIALAALQHKKHLILLNVEADITIGPILHHLFVAANLIYTGSDGDEPASTFELVEFAKAMGMEVLVAGKGKNNKLSIDANPTSVQQEAKAKNMSARILASFADGTKTMAEMTLLSNATGLKADVVGMHGIAGDLDTTVAKLRLKTEGGVLNNYGVVEYVDGLAPGVFVIIKGKSQGVIEQLNYMIKINRDHHILYRPFHLASLETPITIAKAVLNKQTAIVPYANQVSDTVAVAKKDIKAGEVLDGIGGYCVRGVIEDHQLAMEKRHVPIGLIHGNVIAKRDIALGTFISEEDVALDTSLTVYQLRKLQEEMFG